MPAIRVIFHIADDDLGFEDLVRTIARQASVRADKVRDLLHEDKDIGIVNLRAPFRGQIPAWLRGRGATIKKLLQDARSLDSLEDSMGIATRLSRIAPVPLHDQHLAAFTVLSTLIACLDPRNEFPIVNKGKQLRRLFAKLHLSQKSPLEKYEVMAGFIAPDRCKDAFELDTMGDDVLLLGNPVQIPRPLQVGKKVDDADLALRDEREISVRMGGAGWRTMQRVHNQMTRALKELYGNRCEIREGRSRRGKYDALIERYDRAGHDLLIEVKSSTDIGSVRLAIGQLLDYRRYVKRRMATQLGILLPEKPDAEIASLLRDLRIRLLWFSSPSVNRILKEDGKEFVLHA